MGRIEKQARQRVIVLAATAMLIQGLVGPPVARAQPAAAKEQALVQPEAAQADLDALYTGLKRAHFNLYARASRAAYDRLYRRVRAGMNAPLTRLELVRRLQRFTAFGRVAHARIDTAYRLYEAHLDGGGRAFPLELRLVQRGVFVRANRSPVAEIRPGDRLLAIDDVDIDQWLIRCGRNLSADNRYMAQALMELDFPMLLWLEQGERASYAVAIERDGRRRQVTVPGRTRGEMRAVPAGPVLDLAAADRTWRMLNGAVAYLRPGGFYNSDPAATDMYDNSAFRAFIDRAFEGLIQAGARAVIIDLRDNPGGDSSFSDLMVSWFATRPYSFTSGFYIKVSPETVAANAARLPASPAGSISHRFAALYEAAGSGNVARFATPKAEPRAGRRFAGAVYVLVNRNSYSNAVAVAATVQDYGFGQILGEETSDLATTYGAMEHFMLPQSGLRVNYPKAYIVRPSGDRAARGVRPDVAIATPVLESPGDTVLGEALRHAQKRLAP